MRDGILVGDSSRVAGRHPRGVLEACDVNASTEKRSLIDMEHSVTRRDFIAGTAAAAGIAAAAGTGTGLAAAEETESSSANPDWLGEEPEIGEVSDVLETDILIVGAGNGGMVAAATACDLDADYLLAEAYDTPQDTRYYIGAVNSTHTADAGVEVDVERLQYELARYASFKCNQRVQKVWLDESAEMIEWLDGIMDAAGFVAEVDTDLGDEAEPGSSTGNYIPPQQHMYVAKDSTWLESWWTADRNAILLDHIEQAGDADRILWGYELVRLVHSDGKVTGAVFSTDSGTVQINATNVVLATGGYPGNPDMMQELSPAAVACVTSAQYSPKDRGAGIKAGLWAGGSMDIESAPMVFDRGAVEPGVDCGYTESGCFPCINDITLGSQPFMKVARDGRRFCNESAPYDFVCFAASQHDGAVWAQVFDADAAQDVARFNTAGCTKIATAEIEAGQTIDEHLADYIDAGLYFKADTIEELADDLGFTGDARDAFLAEVDKYNGFYDAQDDTDFGKPAYRLSQIRTAPFYGCWYGGELLTTLDGLCVDEEMRVIGSDRTPLEGLYAVGDCSGSFFSGNYPEYLVGVACGRTMTEARHVVRRLAGDL
jgi:fumarate reductase flavoprotein subunit